MHHPTMEEKPVHMGGLWHPLGFQRAFSAAYVRDCDILNKKLSFHGPVRVTVTMNITGVPTKVYPSGQFGQRRSSSSSL